MQKKKHSVNINTFSLHFNTDFTNLYGDFKVYLQQNGSTSKYSKYLRMPL